MPYIAEPGKVAKYLLFILSLCVAKSHSQVHPALLLANDTFQVHPTLQDIYLSPVHDHRNIYLPAPKILPVRDSTLFQKYRYHWILFYDFYTTLTGFHYINSISEQDLNNLYFYYNIDLKSNIEFRKLKWDLYLFNDYGFRHHFDSLTSKTQDQLTFKNSFYYPIVKNQLYISVAANTQTKLWNTHQYREDLHGAKEKYLYDGFMSPGVVMYTGGFTFETSGNSSIHIGLGSSKITRIKNQKIFDSREETEISGIKKGQRKKTEFGISITSTVPMQKINRIIRWEFFGNAFAPLKNYKDIKYYTIDVNNVFHLVLLKYVRLSWRTKINFNYDTNPKPAFLNQVSLGFYLNNQL